MNVLRRYYMALALVALAFLFVAVVYQRLPELVPIHWGSDGEVNGWLPKPWGALILPLTALGSTLLLIFAPAVVPSGFNVASPPKFYPLVVAAIAGFGTFGAAVQLLVAAGAHLNLLRLLVAAAGVLLMITGNFLGKVPRNHLIGIRTPWTLSSEYVWSRTHRLAGPVFVLSGVALLLYALVESGLPDPRVVLFVIGTMVMAPTLYSYLLWRGQR